MARIILLYQSCVSARDARMPIRVRRNYAVNTDAASLVMVAREDINGGDGSNIFHVAAHHRKCFRISENYSIAARL